MLVERIVRLRYNWWILVLLLPLLYTELPWYNFFTMGRNVPYFLVIQILQQFSFSSLLLFTVNLTMTHIALRLHSEQKQKVPSHSFKIVFRVAVVGQNVWVDWFVLARILFPVSYRLLLWSDLERYYYLYHKKASTQWPSRCYIIISAVILPWFGKNRPHFSFFFASIYFFSNPKYSKIIKNQSFKKKRIKLSNLKI